jgi:hypothetical protein
MASISAASMKLVAPLNDRLPPNFPAPQTASVSVRVYRLKPEPLQEVDAWLAPFRRFWSAHVDALERHLDRMDRSIPTKRKTRRRR